MENRNNQCTEFMFVLGQESSAVEDIPISRYLDLQRGQFIPEELKPHVQTDNIEFDLTPDHDSGLFSIGWSSFYDCYVPEERKIGMAALELCNFLIASECDASVIRAEYANVDIDHLGVGVSDNQGVFDFTPIVQLVQQLEKIAS